jgi:hypothetical protein
MGKLQVITGAVNIASLMAIEKLSGYRNVVNLRRVNGDETHGKLSLFSGDYKRLFNSLHGAQSMFEFLRSNPDLYIPSYRTQ